MVRKMEGTGYLRVTIQPGPSTDEKELEEWYNNEHGPLRLRLPWITIGIRHKAVDGKSPTWSASYEVSEVAMLGERIYTRLREERSLRETRVMSTFESLNRKIYQFDSVHEIGSHANGPAPYQLTETLYSDPAYSADFDKWYREDYLARISHITLSVRKFSLLIGGSSQTEDKSEYLIVHELNNEGDAVQVKAALGEALRSKPDGAAHLTAEDQRLWKYHTSFTALKEPPASVITTDGAEIRFQLEGNPADPVVVCINSILTSFHIWDDLTAELTRGINGKTYRMLRYNARGYLQQWSGSRKTTFDVLADDLEYLLSRLNISKVYAVVGVSMGGVTAINFAIRYPALLDRLVACDCNVASSPANNQAWADRIALARGQGMASLAQVTAQRWFTPTNHDAASFAKVVRMIEPASLDGFEQNAGALCDYDLRPKATNMTVPTLLIAGEGDGKLPEAMKNFDIPNARFHSVPQAGHLPMAENPQAFNAVLSDFISS